jgi:mannonate dehydratase
MAIHLGDDPPDPILGLPRVAATGADLAQLLNAIDSPHPMVLHSTGSYGVSKNDLSGM